jgi:16S rRNA (uracil1498-N3)-methyltransferase
VNSDAAATLRRSAAHVLVIDVSNPTLDDATEHHLFRVLRVRSGDPVSVTDGEGRWRSCSATSDGLAAISDVVYEPRRSSPAAVAFAIPKQDRPEWIVQKLTELGIDRIVLLHAERSVVRWDSDRANRHLAKLRRVAEEALQQSRGVWLPAIDGPLEASEVLSDWAVAEPGGRSSDAVARSIAIGPEGGWTADELANSSGQVALGSNVLRVETAAIVAATVILRHGG